MEAVISAVFTTITDE